MMTNVCFRYWNENPNGKHIGDCVTRAITFATGLSYEKVQEKLYYTGKLLECDPLCVDCYEFLLTKYLGFSPIFCAGQRLREFASKYTSGLFLVRSNGHLSVLDNGCIVDTWNCEDIILTKAWKIA